MTKTGNKFNDYRMKQKPFAKLENIEENLGLLTEKIPPFSCQLAVPQIIDLTQDEENSSTCARTIHIKSGKAALYNHEGITIEVPIWHYVDPTNNNDDDPIVETYLGPTFIVNEGQTIEINWVNTLTDAERQPTQAISSKYSEGSEETIPQNVIGIQTSPDTGHTMGCNSRGYFTTHLHGAKIASSFDGGPEDLIGSRPEDSPETESQSHLDRYENKQRATMLWYHDHAMHTTRLNVFSGLAGLWIIRNEEENALNLPSGDHELPLVIQDRNITKIGADAKLLHKIETDEGPLEFFGPLTLVNGVIWPYKNVDNGWYRLRILNGSNSRTYRLAFAEKKNDTFSVSSIPIYQIGSDGGLVKDVVELTVTDGKLGQNEVSSANLTIAPAERVDLLVNFSAFAGKEIFVFNTAEAPFGNAPAPTNFDDIFSTTERIAQLDDRRTPYPHVMKFSINQTKKSGQTDIDINQLKTALNAENTSYHRDVPLKKDEQKIRTVAVVEKTTGEGPVLVLWELIPESDLLTYGENDNDSNHKPILVTKRRISIDGIAFVAVAERYYDPVSFIIPEGSTEHWRFVNLTADTHPMHLHLVQYLPVARWNITKINAIKLVKETSTKPIGDQILEAVDGIVAKRYPCDEIIIETDFKNEHPDGYGLDANEQCLKDTIRVNPGEMVEIRARFSGYHGRFVYHCHLLEHEDHDMMRQFVVTRNDLDLDQMGFPISVGKSCL